MGRPDQFSSTHCFTGDATTMKTKMAITAQWKSLKVILQIPLSGTCSMPGETSIKDVQL
jgi:hypothetical protein